MAKEEKKPQKHGSPPVQPASKSAAPLQPDARPKSSGLSLQQKCALIGGAAILALVLGALLFPSGGESADEGAFSNYLYNNSKNGILVDARGSPSADVRQQIMQCGVNYISSPFYTNGSNKELLAYFCDDSGCLSSDYRFGLPNSTPKASNVSVPFSEALYAMRERAYIHVHAGAEGRDFIYHPTYMEVIIGPKSNPDYCQLRAVVS